jgi:2-oxoglutarate ferredoxin oxidoreductase subunit alpha
MIDITRLAFEKTEEYRVPAMIMGDGMLGQMMEAVELSDNPQELPPPRRDWAATGTKTRREKNVVTSISMNPESLEKLIISRYKRYEKIAETETLWEEYKTDDAEIVLVAYGTLARIAKSAADRAREEGIKVGLIRPITLWPFPDKPLGELCESAKCFLALELSMGQMLEDVKLAVNGKRPVHFYGRTGGMVPEEEEILTQIRAITK